MAETITEQVTCENCGSDVRENTLFCYKCGNRVAGDPEVETESRQEAAPLRSTHITAEPNGSADAEAETEPVQEAAPHDSAHITADPNGSGDGEMSAETRSALDDLVEKLKSEEPASTDPLARASAERKKARVRSRKTQEVVWEAVEEGSYRLFVLTTVLIVVITAAIVFLMVYWK